MLIVTEHHESPLAPATVAILVNSRFRRMPAKPVRAYDLLQRLGADPNGTVLTAHWRNGTATSFECCDTINPADERLARLTVTRVENTP